MFAPLPTSKAAALAAIFVCGLPGTGYVKANVLVNGWFTQPGMYGSQICVRGPNSSISAAQDWAQFAVVPNSMLCTYLETTFLPRIRVKTTGGAWPDAHMGNGIAQSFRPRSCAIASFWYNVVSGQVLGNLVRSDNNAFIDFNTVFIPVPNNPGAWKHFTSIWDKGAEAIFFETLSPVGIIPEVNYQLMNADVEPCAAAPPMTDQSKYLMCSQPGCPPVSVSNDPAAPSVKIRITNVSALIIHAPIHLFVEGAGRPVANPDGDYLGTPYVNLVSSSLAPGQSEDVTIYFSPDPAGSIPIFQIKVVSGNF